MLQLRIRDDETLSRGTVELGRDRRLWDEPAGGCVVRMCCPNADRSVTVMPPPVMPPPVKDSDDPGLMLTVSY